MAAASSSPLFFPALSSTQTLTLNSSRPKFLILASPPPLSSSCSSLSSSSSFKPFTPLGKYRSLRSLLIRNVAVWPDFGQQVEEEEDGSSVGEEVSFSPDLKLFVGNLPFSVDSAELADLFGQAGNVEMVEVIYDKLSGRSRGFGFVTMSTVEEVEVATQQFNGYEIEGRPLRVNSGPPPRKDDFPSRGFRSGGSSSSANRVYVGNLSWGVDDLALETLFSEQGKVLEAKVVYDRESGRSRGFGFVSFSSAQEVDNAISSLNGADLDGRSILVTVADAKPKRQF